MADRLGTISVKVQKWESREQRGKAVYPKSHSWLVANVNGELINLAALLQGFRRGLWSSEGMCEAKAEGMYMLWWVELNPFQNTFAGVVSRRVLYHDRVITDVIIYNEVMPEQYVLLINMTSIFIKMRNLESYNAQRMLCGNWSCIGQPRN